MIRHRLFVGAQLAALAFSASLLAGGRSAADQVIPDDLIVQGSLCVGLDCVNNENFGFDTIRLKENNTRIKFDDTSTSPGFPANDWQLTANDSASGGSSKFSIEDVTGSKIPFTITAGAATNSIFVDSTGRVGLRTSTPVLDVHIATSNTPAHRLEQNNSGGFTAQTWDIAGNEANFFVRDVTSGSRLPLRIRPGAPTSSLDISATGDVGIGTASPETLQGGVTLNGTILQVRNTSDNAQFVLSAAGAGKVPDIKLENSDATATRRVFESVYEGVNNVAKWRFANETNGSITTDNVLVLSNGGNVGVGIASPAARLHTTGSVRFAGVNGCGAGIVSAADGTLSCLASSAQFKHVAGSLEPYKALTNVMALRPQTGAYRDTPDVPEHWLIAEEVAAVDPALVGLNEGKPYVVKTQNVVADLIVVVQLQQHQIEELRRLLAGRP
jgi:hypothetical protein